MGVKLKNMETDEEMKGKAFVHWTSWHETYLGLVGKDYLDGLTLETCGELTYSWPNNIIVAKDGDRVIGFVGYGDRGDESPETEEIFALYVLPEYHGAGMGLRLKEAGLEKLNEHSKISLGFEGKREGHSVLSKMRLLSRWWGDGQPNSWSRRNQDDPEAVERGLQRCMDDACSTSPADYPA